MEDNLFFKLTELIRDEAAGTVGSPWRLGEVVSSSPLLVEVSGTIQDQKSLSKASGLSISKGDSVLLTSLDDDQSFIIICKVVNA